MMYLQTVWRRKSVTAGRGVHDMRRRKESETLQEEEEELRWSTGVLTEPLFGHQIFLNPPDPDKHEVRTGNT